MGRHVLSVPRNFDDSRSLLHATATEKKLSLFYVAGMISFTLGCLSYTPLVPYILEYRWNFFIAASACFFCLNVRDLLIIVHQSIPAPSGEPDGPNFDNQVSIFNADTTSATFLLAGSLMLGNAGVLAKMSADDDLTSKWQLIGSFAAYLVGYGVNTMNFHPDAIDIVETRNAVVFQMSMSTTLNLIGALVDTIGSSDNEYLQTTLKAWLHGIAGVIALGAAFVNHFHTLAFMSNEEILFAEQRFKVVQARKEEDAVQNQTSMKQKLWNALMQSANYLSLRKSKTGKYVQVSDQGSGLDSDPELIVDVKGSSSDDDGDHDGSRGSGTMSDLSSFDDSMMSSSFDESKRSLGQLSHDSLVDEDSKWTEREEADDTFEINPELEGYNERTAGRFEDKPKREPRKREKEKLKKQGVRGSLSPGRNHSERGRRRARSPSHRF